MKILISLLLVLCFTTNGFALGQVEKGVLIGIAAVIGVQHIFKDKDDREYVEYNEYHYHNTHDRPDYRYMPPRRQECIWVTQYHPHTNEPMGYKKYCR